MLEPSLKAQIGIRSTDPRETLSAKLSNAVFGGVPFHTTDVYDEVPCMKLEKDLLGMEVYLAGDGITDFDEDGKPEYHLTLEPLHDNSTADMDFSIYLAQLITTKLTLNCYVLE